MPDDSELIARTEQGHRLACRCVECVKIRREERRVLHDPLWKEYRAIVQRPQSERVSIAE